MTIIKEGWYRFYISAVLQRFARILEPQSTNIHNSMCFFLIEHMEELAFEFFSLHSSNSLKKRPINCIFDAISLL